jgi:4a-hydroxytetrahydrobiopterin dehydratase
MITMMTCWITDDPGPSADCAATTGAGVAVFARGGAPEEAPWQALNAERASGTQKSARHRETMRIGEAYRSEIKVTLTGGKDTTMLLSRAQIAEALETLPGWHHRGNALERVYDRESFDGSIAFVNAVAKLANARDHHPDIAISWNRVTITTTSHDAGGLTDRDFGLAAAIDQL